jgi:hypothetical protein
VVGGDVWNRAKSRRKRFNIYKWGELGVDWGVCLVLAACAGGSAEVAFFPRRLAVWGMAAFVLERLSDREIFGGQGQPAPGPRKKLLMPSASCLPLSATHTHTQGTGGKSGAINEGGPIIHGPFRHRPICTLGWRWLHPLTGNTAAFGAGRTALAPTVALAPLFSRRPNRPAAVLPSVGVPR